MTRTFTLDAAGRARVNAAVTAAEERTAGEIVTILADRSDDYHDIALAWAALAGFAALIALSLAPDFYLGLYDRLTHGWARPWEPAQILALAASIAMLTFAAMWLLLLWPPLRLALAPPAVRHARVRARAIACFRVGAERRTHGRTGILIYLSMREHRAEIVADEAIAGKVAPEVWGEAMAAMLAHIRAGAAAEGLAAAVERVGAVLARHFPRDGADINELPDRLIEV